MTGRALALIVRLLPGHRREWGEAMQAELAALADGGARRRHALGCARAVLVDPGAVRTLALYALAFGFGAWVLALSAGIASLGVRLETLALVAILGVVVWAGRRRGVADEPLARWFRASGYALVGGCLLLLLTAPGGSDDPGGWWVAGLAITLCLIAVQVLTARGANTGALPIVAAVALTGAVAWWVPLLLFAGVRSHPEWALAVVAACTVLAALLAGRSGEGELAALATGFAACLLIFVVAVATYAAFPALAPDIATAQAVNPVLENRIESTDPYIGELLLGALLGVALIGAAGVKRAAIRL